LPSTLGEPPPDAKWLKGLSGVYVLEPIEDHRGTTTQVSRAGDLPP